MEDSVLDSSSSALCYRADEPVDELSWVGTFGAGGTGERDNCINHSFGDVDVGVESSTSS